MIRQPTALTESVITSPLFRTTIPYSRRELTMPGIYSTTSLPYSMDSSYQINISFKRAESGNKTVNKNKTFKVAKTGQKGILKVKKHDAFETMSGSTSKLSENEQTISKRRRNSGSTAEKTKACVNGSKKKVKFEDKFDKLHAIERKYRLLSDGNGCDNSSKKVDNSDSQRQLQRPTTRTEEDRQTYNTEMSEVFELPFPTYEVSPVRLQPKSGQQGVSVKENEGKYLENQDHSVESHKEKVVNHCDVRLGIDKSYDVAIEGLVITNSKCTSQQRSKPSKDNSNQKCLVKSPKLSFSNRNESQESNHPKNKSDGTKNLKCHYNISGKTVINTEGGATVTRSRVKPSMFSLLSHEITPAPLVPPRSYRNFCDEGKTDLIVRWIENVSSVQAKEGFCTLLHTDDLVEHRNDN